MYAGTYGQLDTLKAEINRQAMVKQDAIIPTDKMQFITRNEKHFITGRENDMALNATDLCVKQIATRSGIGGGYLSQMIDLAPELLDANINYWWTASPKNRLVRTLDGNARAFMSDRYKTMDNKPIMDTIFNILDMNDIEVKSCDVTNSRMYLKVVSPKLEGEVSVGDPVQMGVAISNSEVGLGALDIRPLIYRLVCDNGMVSATDYGANLKKVHLGPKHDLGIVYSKSTQDVVNQGLMLQIKDTITSALSEDTFRQHLDSYRAAKEKKITGNVVDAVKALGKLTGFTETEGDQILNRLVDGGDRSMYGLMNSLSAFAQDPSLNYDRASQMEIISGKVISLNNRQWKSIAEAA